MDPGISKEELTETIKNLEIVEQLPRTAIQEFCRVFKITEGNSDVRALVSAFQNKIADVFVQEREAYEDYLQLPKFRAMGPELCQQLIALFKRVWIQSHQNQQHKRLRSVAHELQALTPAFSSQAQAEKFHLSLLQLYKQSELCSKRKTGRGKKSDPTKSQRQNCLTPEDKYGSQYYQNQIKVPQGVFPYFGYPNPVTKVEAQEGVSYFLDNKQQQLMNIPPTHPPPTQSQSIFEVPRFQLQAPFLVPSSQLDYYQNQVKLGYPGLSLPTSMFSQQMTQQTIRKFKSYQYVQCYCEGKRTVQSIACFKCISCGYSYHYPCMTIHDTTCQSVTCPLCILRKETIFCKVVNEPLKFIWHLQEKNKYEFHLKMTDEDSTQIYDARKYGLDCQVRFLKIDGTLFKRDKKSELQIFQQEVRHSEITLPELCQDKNRPISLEVLLRADDETDESRRLYFFAIFLVRMKKIQQIIMEVFDGNNYFAEDYYNDFMDQSEKVVVPLKENGQKDGLIKYPVRGAECRHAQVFDFKKYLQKISDLKREKQKLLACEICGEACSSFKYDLVINRCVNGFADYEERQQDAIQISRNGEIEWVFLNQQKGDASGEEQQDVPFIQEEDS